MSRTYSCPSAGMGCEWEGEKTAFDVVDAHDHDGKDWACPECGAIFGAVNPETVEHVDW